MRLPTDDEFLAEDARRSLRAFVAEAWPIVEPGTPYVPNWHIDAICDHLLARPPERLPTSPPGAVPPSRRPPLEGAERCLNSSPRSSPTRVSV